MGQTSIPCRTAIRDRLAEDKPADMDWSQYLDVLHSDAEFIVVDGDTDAEAIAAQLLDQAQRETIDADTLAREVARRFDYAELSKRVADELEGRLR